MEKKNTNELTSMKEAQYILEQTIGFAFQAALRAAVELNLADHMEHESKTAEQIAIETNTDAKVLKRILRLLASRNIFTCENGTHFTLTPSAKLLLSSHPYSVRQAILWLTDKTFWVSSNQLSQYASGKNVFEELYGTSYFEYWGKNTDNINGADEGIASLSKIENYFTLKEYSFPQNVVIADIGGGLGGLLLQVLENNPTTKGILFDQRHVINKHILHKLNNHNRWTTQAGSFFEKCPEADIYLLKYITHNWEDHKIVQILKTIRQAMKATSKLLIIECIVYNDNQPYFGNKLDILCMTVFHTAGEHTEDQFNMLLTQADLKINRIIPTESHIYIIEAIPI